MEIGIILMFRDTMVVFIMNLLITTILKLLHTGDITYNDISYNIFVVLLIANSKVLYK
jgi:hypothetical protein